MNSTQIFGTFRKSPYICSGEILQIMLVLQDCIGKLSEFKQTFGSQFGITKLGIFGSVALFSCNVDLVRFRSTLRPRFKSNILNDVVYV